eukprot:TRINITY_DN2561_c0_g1_i4.p1 TRINITY_DN2561_c0_g1~~TRINITY_DN2561_c0_g1_i4.p1  ORF type:complete len:552 (+),score=169.15 TRINITY_DN2561_c0_g1_i4:105-1760(+)
MDDSKYLLNWVNSFPNRSKDAYRLEDLYDGVVLTQVFHNIDATYFPIDTLKTNDLDNFELVLSNCKKLVRNLQTYFSEVFHLSRELHLHKVDASRIANSSAADIAIVIELSVYAAVQSDGKARWVQNMMRLDASTQAVLKGVIEKILSWTQEEPESPQANSQEIQNLNRELSEKTILLEAEMKKNAKLVAEIDKLQEQEQVWKSREMELSLKNENLERQYRDLQKTTENDKQMIYQLGDEVARMQTTMDEFRKTKAELARVSEEAKDLKQQLEAMSDLQERLEKSEAQVERYKKRIEDLGDLQRQLKDSQTELQVLRKSNAELQDSLSKASSNKGAQQESAQANAVLRDQLAKAQEDLSNKQHEFEKLKLQNDSAMNEISSLRKQIMSLKDISTEHQETDGSHPNVSTFDLEMRLGQMEDTVSQLRQENVRLKDQVAKANAASSESSNALSSKSNPASPVKQLEPSSFSASSGGDEQRIADLEKMLNASNQKLRESMEKFKQQTTAQQKEIHVLNSSLYSLALQYYTLMNQRETPRLEPFLAQRITSRDPK